MRLEGWIVIYFSMQMLGISAFLLRDKRQWGLETENINENIFHGSER
jgi:hypothetical protein